MDSFNFILKADFHSHTACWNGKQDERRHRKEICLLLPASFEFQLLREIIFLGQNVSLQMKQAIWRWDLILSTRDEGKWSS